MSNFDIRNFSFWYGPAHLEIDPFLDSPWLEFAEILSNFKRGIFDQRNDLIDLCRKYRDEKVGIFGLQLFFLVARAQDLELVDQYIRGASDKQLRSLAIFSINSMIGLPLARWFVSTVSQISCEKEKRHIGDHLESLLSKENRQQLGFDEPILKILNVIEQSIPSDAPFIFCGKPAFLGDIAIRMQLLMQVALSIEPAAVLGDGTGPTLLSAASGLECPVSYTTVMTLDKVKLVLDYVKAVSAMGKAMGGWKHGSKYFYGHEIV